MSPSYSYKLEINSINNVNLVQILKESEKGAEVLNFFEKENVLDDFHKDILTSIIVDSYSNNRKFMSMNDIVSATNAIISIFPSENKVSFFSLILFFISVYIYYNLRFL